MLSGEATHTNCIVFCLTRPELEPTIYRILGEHYYATDAVYTFHMNSLYLLREKKDTFTLSAKFTANNILYILVKKRNITPLSISITFLIQTIFYDELLFSSLYVVMNIDMCTKFISVQLNL